MSELLTQINKITKEITEIYGEARGKKYYDASITLMNKLSIDDGLKEYQIIVNIIEKSMNNVYKQIKDIQMELSEDNFNE